MIPFDFDKFPFARVEKVTEGRKAPAWRVHIGSEHIATSLSVKVETEQQAQDFAEIINSNLARCLTGDAVVCMCSEVYKNPEQFHSTFSELLASSSPKRLPSIIVCP